jgi:UDP-2-acetamido-3-amino-2,3-dideoxy-glucuronate N-acetyltransferase
MIINNKYIMQSQNYINPLLEVESSQIGKFCVIETQERLGQDCKIGSSVFIDTKVRIGDRVTINSGANLSGVLHIEDDVFIGANVTFATNHFFCEQSSPNLNSKTHVLSGASIASGAIIGAGLTIGKKAQIREGAVVMQDVPAYSIVSGNPAQIVGYTETQKKHHAQHLDFPQTIGKKDLDVRGASIHRFKCVKDLRGDLTVGNLPADIPFLPQRFFIVSNVPNSDVRGEHAHRECHQFLVVPHGAVSCLVDDGCTREEVRLDSPELGLYMPPKVWGVQYKYSSDAVLFVFASHPYDPDDYVRDYDEFCKLVQV